MSKYGYLEVFRESLGIRDNESRLYMIYEELTNLLLMAVRDRESSLDRYNVYTGENTEKGETKRNFI